MVIFLGSSKNKMEIYKTVIPILIVLLLKPSVLRHYCASDGTALDLIELFLGRFRQKNSPFKPNVCRYPLLICRLDV
jgi:hypothetical protein